MGRFESVIEVGELAHPLTYTPRAPLELQSIHNNYIEYFPEVVPPLYNFIANGADVLVSVSQYNKLASFGSPPPSVLLIFLFFSLSSPSLKYTCPNRMARSLRSCMSL